MPPRFGVGHEADIVCKTKVEGDCLGIPEQRLHSGSETSPQKPTEAGTREGKPARKLSSAKQLTHTQTQRGPVARNNPSPSTVDVQTARSASSKTSSKNRRL